LITANTNLKAKKAKDARRSEGHHEENKDEASHYTMI
jgi:hypothetical protein